MAGLAVQSAYCEYRHTTIMRVKLVPSSLLYKSVVSNYRLPYSPFFVGKIFFIDRQQSFDFMIIADLLDQVEAS